MYQILILSIWLKTLVLILPKISAYIKIFKNKDGKKNNRLMFFHIENEKKLFEKYNYVD